MDCIVYFRVKFFEETKIEIKKKGKYETVKAFCMSCYDEGKTCVDAVSLNHKMQNTLV